MKHKSNGFDALRLIAASMVIFGHAYPLTKHVAPGICANSVQTVGVKIFFVISGYLIARSWQRDPSVVHFFIKRALRLLPALILLCAITVLIVGTLFTTLHLVSYFSNRNTWTYFWNILLYPVYFLPGVFADNIYGTAINGSLWSLPVEVGMYCGVPVLSFVARRHIRIAFPLAATVLLALSVYFVRIAPPEHPPVFYGTNLISALDVAYYFYAGASILVLGIDRCGNWLIGTAQMLLVAFIGNSYVGGELLLAAVLPYFVISIGTLHISQLVHLERHDYSYGLYLYGFLVQQSVIAVFGPLTPLANAAISLPIAALFASVSWWLVERRALSIKPNRGRSAASGGIAFHSKGNDLGSHPIPF